MNYHSTGIRVLALVLATSAAGWAAPTVRFPIRHAVSQPASQLPQASPVAIPQLVPLGAIHRSLGPAAANDDALQVEVGPLVSITPGIHFDGVGVNGSEPSDANMAVGPNHLVQTVNSEWAVYDKTGHIFSGFPKSLGSIWTNLGGACTGNQGDPVAQYDRLADRWFLAQIGSESAPFSLCLAISTTNDPTGSYNLYEYQFTNFPDYPKFGVWPTASNPAYLGTIHLFQGNTFLGTEVCAYDRTAMLAGNASPAQICDTIANDGGFLPSDLDGSMPPPNGSPGYFVTFETTSLHEFQLAPNFASPGSSTFTGPINIPVSAFSMPCGGTGGTCVPQPSPGLALDTLGDRMMYRMAYRNFGDHESMVVNHTVANGSSGAPRWYEIRTPLTPTIFQQGTFAPDSIFRWMGSIAMDKVGDIFLGYSASSSSIHPGIRWTGRIPGDAAGTMEAEAILLNGTGSQSGHSRWGDYSAMRIDPSDDCTFWYTNQYLSTSGDFIWKTHIGSASFPNCTGGGQGDFSIGAQPPTVTIHKGGTATYTVSIGALSGFNGTVTFSITGKPTWAKATFTPASVTGSGTSTLTVKTNPFFTATKTFHMTITGTSGSLVHSTMVDMVVTP